jgi:hypothetical protein
MMNAAGLGKNTESVPKEAIKKTTGKTNWFLKRYEVNKSWDEVRGQLERLKSELGSDPVMFLDYNGTIVLGEQDPAVEEEYLRLSAGKTWQEEMYERRKALLVANSGNKYEGEIVDGVKECIEAYKQAGCQPIILTKAFSTLWGSRTAKLKEGGIYNLLKVPKGKINTGALEGGEDVLTMPGLERENDDGYVDGQVFVDRDKGNKGEAVKLLVEKKVLRNKPTHIILVDDLEENLNTVGKECEKQDIPYTGILIKHEAEAEGLLRKSGLIK